jgi:hypothetical protein
MSVGCKEEANQACDEPTDCCSGYCDPVTQVCTDPSCTQDCSTSPCDVGGGKGGCEPFDDSAIAEVLVEDVVCRCLWDAFCVAAFKAKTQVTMCPP